MKNALTFWDYSAEPIRIEAHALLAVSSPSSRDLIRLFCHSRLPKVIQGYSRPFNPIQAFWKKVFFYLPSGCHISAALMVGPLTYSASARPFKGF